MCKYSQYFLAALGERLICNQNNRVPVDRYVTPIYVDLSKGLLVRGFSWFVANPFIFSVLLVKNDVGYIPRTSSPLSYYCTTSRPNPIILDYSAA